MHTDTPCAHKQTVIITSAAEVLYPVCPQGIHLLSMTLAVGGAGVFSITAVSTVILEDGRPKASAKALGSGSAAAVLSLYL